MNASVDQLTRGRKPVILALTAAAFVVFLPLDRAGAASAVASTSRQVGVSLVVALCGSIAASAIAAPDSSFVADARPLWLVCAALGLLVLGLGLYSTTPRALRSAERLASLFGHPGRGHADVHA